MQTSAVQHGPSVLKAMPINQKTNLLPTERFHLAQKMQGMIAEQPVVRMQKADLGSIVDRKG